MFGWNARHGTLLLTTGSTNQYRTRCSLHCWDVQTISRGRVAWKGIFQSYRWQILRWGKYAVAFSIHLAYLWQTLYITEYFSNTLDHDRRPLFLYTIRCNHALLMEKKVCITIWYPLYFIFRSFLPHLWDSVIVGFPLTLRRFRQLNNPFE